MNNIVYADTNIFLRYLTNEPPDLSKKVSKFFNEMELGKYRLFVCNLVVSELVYVLEKVFEIPKKEICEKVKILMLKKNIVLENSQIIFRALDIYRDFNINFVDAYIYSHSNKNGIKKYFTFDNHFKKFNNIELVQ
jgi:uncharacterized protein